MGVQFIDGAEIQIPRDEDRPAVALILVERGFDVDGGLKNEFRHAVAGRGGMLIDPQTLPTPAAGLRRGGQTDPVLHKGEEKGRAQPVPPMVIHDPHQSGGAERIGRRGVEIDHDSRGSLDSGPEEKEAALALRHRRRIFADRFRSSFKENNAPVVTVHIAVQDTGRHAGDFIDHPHGQGAVDRSAFWQDEIAITQETGLDFWGVRWRQEPTDGTGSVGRRTRWCRETDACHANRWAARSAHVSDRGWR